MDVPRKTGVISLFDLVVGVVVAVLYVLEFLVVSHFLGLVARAASQDGVLSWPVLATHVLRGVLAVSYLLCRFGGRLERDAVKLPSQLLPASLLYSLFLSLNIVLPVYVFQRLTGTQVLSFVKFGYPLTIVDLVLVAPVQEELFFRGVIHHVFEGRLWNDTVTVVGTNVLFGAIHLFNLAFGRSTYLYVILQAVLGTLVGSFFSLRRIRTGSVWEPIALHSINNAFALLLPPESFRFTSGAHCAIVLETIVMYTGMIVIEIRSWRVSNVKSL